MKEKEGQKGATGMSQETKQVGNEDKEKGKD